MLLNTSTKHNIYWYINLVHDVGLDFFIYKGTKSLDSYQCITIKTSFDLSIILLEKSAFLGLCALIFQKILTHAP